MGDSSVRISSFTSVSPASSPAQGAAPSPTSQGDAPKQLSSMNCLARSALRLGGGARGHLNRGRSSRHGDKEGNQAGRRSSQGEATHLGEYKQLQREVWDLGCGVEVKGEGEGELVGATGGAGGDEWWGWEWR